MNIESSTNQESIGSNTEEKSLAKSNFSDRIQIFPPVFVKRIIQMTQQV